MIQLLPIKTDHVFYNQVEKLLLESFPPEERRSESKQRTVTDTNPYFKVYALVEERNFIGVITCWRADNFVYVEHFATVPEVRGKGIGSQVLELLAQKHQLPMVLEVELPETEIAARRISFYERNGFVLWKNSRYIQPPYQIGLMPVELHLMVRGAGLDEQADFNRIKEWLYKEVYQCSDLSLGLS